MNSLPAHLPARIEHLRLRDLLLLEHIADTGSLRQAATRLNVTQPAVTQVLQGLENAFGVPLVVRTQRGAHLTPAGAAALQRLRVARRELIAAHAAARNPQAMSLRLGVLPLVTLGLLPGVLRALRFTLPDLRVTLTESTVSGLWQQLVSAELDAIICRMPPAGEFDLVAAGVVHDENAAQERMVLVAGRDHPAVRAMASRKTPTIALLKMLQAHTWVLPPAGAFTRTLLDQLFLSAGLAAPEAAVTSMSFHTNLHLAAQCGLLAVVPESAFQSYMLALPVVKLAAPWGPGGGGIVLAWRASSTDEPVITTLRSSFAAAAKNGKSINTLNP